MKNNDLGEPSSSHPSSTDQSILGDEIKEIERPTEKETARIRAWRLIATAILLATGVAVATCAYKALIKQEQKNFEDAVSE